MTFLLPQIVFNDQTSIIKMFTLKKKKRPTLLKTISVTCAYKLHDIIFQKSIENIDINDSRKERI